MLNMEVLSRSVLCTVVSFLVLSFATGDVRFTRFPPSVVPAIEGNNSTLDWEYYVSDKTTEFALKSPTWEYYDDTRNTWIEIANEAFARSWNWTVSPSCPPSLKPRLKKLFNATIQIVSVTLNDTGRYRCSLVLPSGSSIIKETRLNVTKAPVITPTPTLSTSPVPSSSLLPTPTSTPSGMPPTIPTKKRIKEWVIIVIVIVVIIVLVAAIFIGCYCCCPKYLTDCCNRVCRCCPWCRSPCCGCPCCYGPCKIGQGSSEEEGGEMKSKPPSADK